MTDFDCPRCNAELGLYRNLTHEWGWFWACSAKCGYQRPAKPDEFNDGRDSIKAGFIAPPPPQVET